MGKYGDTLDAIMQQCEANPKHYSEILSSLSPKVSRSRIRVKCPSCGDFSGWLEPGDRLIKCDHKIKCAGKTHILAAMVGSTAEMLDGDIFKDAVRQAAALTGVAIDETFDFSPPKQVDRNALESIWQASQNFLQHDRDATDYLLRRNFHSDFIAQNFGYLPNGFVANRLVSDEEYRKTGLVSQHDTQGEHWADRIIIPARDKWGRLIALIGRCIAQETRSDKYRYTTGFKKTEHLFNAHNARNHTQVIVTEGQLDCLKLLQYGYPHAVAAGGCSLNADQLLQLSEIGCDRAIIFFDADKAGEDGIMRLLDTYDAQRESPELMIGEVPHGKDPDEYIDLFGLNQFLELASRATHAHRYRARYWFKNLQRDGLGIIVDGELPRYIERCAKYIDSIESHSLKLRATQIFLPEVCQLSGVERSDIRAVRAEYTTSEQRKKNTKRLMQSLGSAFGQIKDGNYHASRELLQSALLDTRDIKAKFPTPDEAIAEVRDYFKKIASRPLVGVRTGFKPFDDNLSGARGFIVLAGGSNVGKTTLMGDLLSDICIGTDDTCVLFLSCEMLRREIVARLYSRLAERNWLDLRDLYTVDCEAAKHYENRLHNEVLRNCLIVNPRTDSFVFTPQNMTAAINYCKEITQRSRCAVIVDYLDVVPGHEDQSRGNEAERQKYICDDMLAVKAEMGDDDPLLAITAVRKEGQAADRERLTMSDVMGSAYKVYCADIVCVWNAFSDKMLYEYCDLTNDYVPILARQEIQESDWSVICRKAETRMQVRKAREHLEHLGIGFSRLELAKVRDGMRKGAFNVTVNYYQSSIQEGLHL